MLGTLPVKLASLVNRIPAAVTYWNADHKRNRARIYLSDKQCPAGRNRETNSALDIFVPVGLRVNGLHYDLVVDPRVSLLDCLREHLHLAGTKIGCKQGACGACTVLLDGERVNACLVLAVQCEGREITTIEGLGADALGRAAQAAFVNHEAIQCGYCTPGQLCSTVAMLAEMASASPSAVTEDLTTPAIPVTDEEIKERMAGNLCRCGAYNGLIAAICELARRKLAR